MASKLLTVADVAKLMQIDKHKVYRIINSDLIKTIQVSGKRGTRVPEFEYERFVRESLGKDIEKLITVKEITRKK